MEYALDLHSDKVPDVTYRPPISDLFAYFSFNWSTLWPALALLFGVLFAFFAIKIFREYY